MNEGVVVEVRVNVERHGARGTDGVGRVKHTVTLKCLATGRGSDQWYAPARDRKVTLSEMKWVVLK